MKILSLQFTNLNSLKGSWHIDFSQDAFVRDGIFAIIGQTGAGKTTILDAICLAIYGQTPRIKQISTAHNELMSLGTGECAAQVELEIGGQYYRFSWQQRRAGGKSDGKLQAIRREISQIKHAGDDSGDILETKPSLCDKKAVQIMRMNFEQFTRSVMLAQGNFAAFLKADAGEKGEILEQITGTQIYAKISAKAFEVEKIKRLALNTLQDKLSDHVVMSDDEYFGLEKTIKNDKNLLYKLKTELLNTEQIIKKLEQKAQHEQQIQSLTQALADSEQALADFRPNFIMLDKANKAYELDGEYTTLAHFRQQKSQHQAEQTKLHQALSTAKSQLTDSLAQKKLADDKLSNAQNQLQQSLPIFRQVRELDTKLSHANEQLLQLQNTGKKYTDELNKISQNLDNLRQEKTDTERKLTALSHSKNHHIHENLAHDGQLIGSLTAHQADLDHQILGLGQLTATLDDSLARMAQLEKEITQKRQDYRQAKTLIEHKTAEYASLQQKSATLAGVATPFNADDIFHHGAMLAQKIHAHRQLLSHLNTLFLLFDEQRQHHQQISEKINKINELKSENINANTHINELNTLLSQEENTLNALQKTHELQLEIGILQKHLNELEDGKPCPLCGSLTHPNKQAHSNNGHIQLTDDAIAHATQKIRQLTTELQTAKTQQSIIENNLENLNKNLSLLQEKSPTINQKISALHEQAYPLCQNLGFDGAEIDEENFAEFLEKISEEEQNLSQILLDYQILEPQLKSVLNELNQAKDSANAILKDGEMLKNHIELHSQQLKNQQDNIQKNSMVIHEKIIKILSIFDELDGYLGDAHQITSDISLDNITLDKLSKINNNILEKINIITHHYQEFQHTLTQQQSLEKQLNDLEIHINHQTVQRQTADKNWQENQHQIEEISSKINSLNGERFDMFGDKNADDEETLLRQQLENANLLQQQASEILSSQQHAITSLDERLEMVKIQTTKTAQLIADKTTQFHQALTAKGFQDEQEFLTAKLPDAKRKALNEQAQALHYSVKKTGENLVQQRQALQLLTDTIGAHDSLDELCVQRESVQNQERLLLQNLGKNQQILTNARLERDRHAGLIEQINKQKQDIEIWAKLNELIGSADGKKYRNFVQGLTLDMMLYHANEILSRMNERYILCHGNDDNKLLEINVIDTQQGNEERSTKNLSGGESFIISLALALGLSKMSSENISIDSLFLDEGFGTLDEEILDIALSTLAALQEEGKMIGIISHVASLKERISTQITVHKGANGTSRLSGAGVQRLSSA